MQVSVGSLGQYRWGKDPSFSRTAQYTGISASDLPQTSSLLPNYPNPFAGSTHIPFDLFEESNIALTIYDLLARPIRILHMGTLPAGHYLMNWDGQNNQGLRMPSGTYIFVLENTGKRLVRRLNLVR